MTLPFSVAAVGFEHGWPLWLVGLALGWRILMDRFDRGRIRADIAGGGGRVIDISWNPFGRGWLGESSDRTYEVAYINRAGKSVTATCKTSMLTGVFWSSDTPPSDFSAETAEPARCLSCGARIPAERTRCPNCNWTYDESSPGNGNG